MAKYTEDGLEIPPKPKTPEPALRLGWQWVDAHWAAYWVMQSPFPIEEEYRRPVPYPDGLVAKHMEALHWWETDKLGSKVFAKIMETTDTMIVEQSLVKWVAEFDLLQSASVVVAEDTYLTVPDVTRLSVLFLYTAKQGYPITITISSHVVTSGRHRIYAAWNQGVKEVFALAE